MEETTKAYMAGIFDHSGFALIKHTKPNLTVTIPINMLYTDGLSVFEENYGIKYTSFKNINSRHKIKSEVCCIFSDSNAAIFLTDIYPYLRSDRAKRIAELASEYYGLIKNNTQTIPARNPKGGKQQVTLHNLNDKRIKELKYELHDLV